MGIGSFYLHGTQRYILVQNISQISINLTSNHFSNRDNYDKMHLLCKSHSGLFELKKSCLTILLQSHFLKDSNCWIAQELITTQVKNKALQPKKLHATRHKGCGWCVVAWKVLSKILFPKPHYHLASYTKFPLGSMFFTFVSKYKGF